MQLRRRAIAVGIVVFAVFDTADHAADMPWRTCKTFGDILVKKTFCHTVFPFLNSVLYTLFFRVFEKIYVKFKGDASFMIYTIADTHLSFTTAKPMDIFGARWANHAEKLKENWIQTVKYDDTVVIPGDISWGIDLDEALEDLRFLDALPGKKIIGKGNHDYWWTTVSKMNAFFAENGISTISFLYNNAHLVEDKIICGTRGWMSEFGIKTEDARIIAREAARLELSLSDGERLKAQNPDATMLVFTHYPVVFGDFICDDILDVLYRHGIKDVYYGHLHGVSESALDKEYLGIRFHLVAGDHIAFMPKSISFFQ